jgi:hypothetical protein
MKKEHNLNIILIIIIIYTIYLSLDKGKIKDLKKEY